MNSTGSTANTASMSHLEKATQPESDLSGDTEREADDVRESIPSVKLGDSVELDESEPADGGIAAWLVVLGAWCCSLSSAGWINSTYYSLLNFRSE